MERSLSVERDLRFLRLPLELRLVSMLAGDPADDSSDTIFTVTSELFPPSKADLFMSLELFADWSFDSTPRILSSFVSLVSLTMKSSHA